MVEVENMNVMDNNDLSVAFAGEDVSDQDQYSAFLPL
jgi:hypothetical protein